MERRDLSWYDCGKLAERTAYRIGDTMGGVVTGYAVPRGGIYAALLISSCASFHLDLVEDPEKAQIFIDDVVDSGSTRHHYFLKYGKPFFALVDKTVDNKGVWFSFPWERVSNDASPRENIVRILEYIGEDPKREGLLETPDRVIRSYDELFAGYKQDPKDVMKVFEDGACDEMVVLKDIEFSSCCEHHMIFFGGKAHIAYIPNGRVIGISKLARVLEIYARRLQVQERLTRQVTAALDEYLKPNGSACVIEARHSCMACRGVRKQNSIMMTSSLTGEFLKPEVRAEFFSLIRS